MTKRDRVVWVVIFASAIAWSAMAVTNTLRANLPYNPWLDLAVSWAYFGAGLIALVRRPRNVIGVIMAAVGFLWLSHNFGHTGEGSVLQAAFSEGFNGTSIPVTMHLVFAYPTGRLHRRSERTLIVAGYCAVLLFLSLYFTFVAGLEDGPASAALFPSALLTRITLAYGAAGPIIFSLVAIALLVRRFVTATPMQRRSYPELWIAASGASALVIGTAIQIRFFTTSSLLINNTLSVVKILIPMSLLVGLFRIQLSRAAVGGLVVELGAPDKGLRDVLGRALGDPSVEVVYWLPERQSFVDELGRAVELPHDDPRRAVTVIERDGKQLAALVHDPALGERPELVEAATAATALALENARLQADLRVQLAEVQASRTRIVEAADAERVRIERNLHDGAQQRLLALSFALKAAQRTASEHDAGKLTVGISAAVDELNTAMAELRELARGIHPAILDEEGLGPALESLAERAPLPTSVSIEIDGRLTPPVEVTAYFVVAESLTNIAKYASASRASIHAARRNSMLHVEVTDDGIGGADPTRGSGLRGLVDRVSALGGRFEVESAPDRGTRIVADIPCE